MIDEPIRSIKVDRPSFQLFHTIVSCGDINCTGWIRFGMPKTSASTLCASPHDGIAAHKNPASAFCGEVSSSAGLLVA